MDEEAQTREVGPAEGADPQPQIPERAAGDPPGTWDDPRLPWSGRPRRVDILCWAGIMLSGIFYWVTLPLRTHLVGTHPVWSELIHMNDSWGTVPFATSFWKS